MHLDLIITLTAALTAALVCGYVTHRAGLSPIVGYLLAGVALGPGSPGFTANKELADQLAEIGVILLMFGVGLQFHFEDLLKTRRVAIPGAICQSLAATALGALLCVQFGWSWSTGIVFGLAVSVASTVVLIRVLSDSNDLHTPVGHIAVGWLVVEDIFTVLVLVLLPALFGGETQSAGAIATSVAWAVGQLILLMVIMLAAGSRVIPKLLEHAAATRSRELFTLTVLVIALGIAIGSAKVFGVSMALGAFLAGMVVGRSEFSVRAVSEALPMRDAFAVIFFVSVGMLFHPRYLIENPWLIAGTLAIILIGKPLAAILIVSVLGCSVHSALTIGIALAQIGEFSFILATLGGSLGILPDTATNALVAAAIISISINPVLYRLNRRLESWARKHPRFWLWFGTPRDRKHLADGIEDQSRKRSRSNEPAAIVVGYGPVGRTVTRLLRENGVEPIVLELNIDTVRQLKEDGINAICGDATHFATFDKTDVSRAVALILSTADVHGREEMIRQCREINPKIRVIARTAFLKDVPSLKEAGADVVFSGEGEVALTMTEFILRQLGAVGDQIDREEYRIRKELFGDPTFAAPLMVSDDSDEMGASKVNS
ncbi:MAG: cation:proton antiporter [Candidatus Hydrogenedentes bacterium]|nr:cation:proton antiporter [Candidatus Hydrogenedentota bacterium]